MSFMFLKIAGINWVSSIFVEFGPVNPIVMFGKNNQRGKAWQFH
jgi:hypothetical protein